MTYVGEFLSLRCSGDILNVCSPIKGYEKEISEAMGVRKEIKKIVLKKPNKFSVFDVCSGNALTPILSAFSLPVKHAYAVDKLVRDRQWQKVKKFSYINANIGDFSFIQKIPEGNLILTACHVCKDLAYRIIDLLYFPQFEHLIMIPCCHGSIKMELPILFKEKLSSYDEWCFSLYEYARQSNFSEIKIKMIKDDKILSPKNTIIVVSKVRHKHD